MATHASILAWRIPTTEEPGGLQSMGLKRVGHNLCDQHTEQLLVISAAVGWGGRSWHPGQAGQGCSPASCSAQDCSPLKPCCMLTFCGPLPFPPYHTPHEVEHLSPFLRQEKEGSERFSHLPKITQQL